MKESEVKARLAQAETHFTHYRWDDAVASFEAILANHPDHPAATQGWATAVEQRSIDEELVQALAKARASLAAHRFDDALNLLNHAQARGALSHILKHHSEIDRLRSEAQEGQEWQRRIEAATRETEELAGRRRFDQALEVLDDTLRPVRARGWAQLSTGLAALREKLWAERDVSERIQFAQAAYEREDYGLAAELATVLHEEMPGREDVRRLRERAQAASARLQERLVAVNEALAEGRTDDALALLGALQAEHPHNPDWQSIALRVRMDQGRSELAKGRAAMADQAFEDAAAAFEAAHMALTAVVEIFPEHPTAPLEQQEAAALRQSALAAGQAARDRAAFRWEASAQSWQASRERLAAAIATRGRDFGEVAAVIDAALAEAQAGLANLEQARLMLADGRQALAARDATTAREAFRAGLSRIEGGRLGNGRHLDELREGLAAGLREAERIQRDVKKQLSQAEAAGDAERLALLRRAYERWETAPGLVTRLAEELLRTAAASVAGGDEDAALALCAEVGDLADAPPGALADAQRLSTDIAARRAEAAEQAESEKARARAGAVEQALRPVMDALRDFDTFCEPAADGDIAAVDWDAAGRALKDARRALRGARSLPPPPPAEWEELTRRVEMLERRTDLLRRAREQMASGKGIDAIPALQAHVGRDADPLVLAVLEKLLGQSGGDAADAARQWLAQAIAALERGEPATCEACIALAHQYAAAAPQVIPEIRRVERHSRTLTDARDRMREARAASAAGDRSAALALYRNALELTADGESGLPADARQAIRRALDREDAPDADDAPPALPDHASSPMFAEFVAPALAPWLRLARQGAANARLAAELGRARRRLRRSRRLADLGAYSEALAELGDDVALESDAGEDLADEASELRITLNRLISLREQLWPLLDQMRAAALEGEFDAALALREQAELFDPGRRAAALWEELDTLAAVIEKRASERLKPILLPSARLAPSAEPLPAALAAAMRVEAASADLPPAGAGAVPPTPLSQAYSEPPAEPARADVLGLAPPREQPPEPKPVMEVAPVQPMEPDEPVAPDEPAAPFDLDDWLSNVTELGPEATGPGDES